MKWVLLIVLAIAVLYYWFPIITVCEFSMLPTYHDKEIILGTRLFRRKIKVGDIVIYRTPNNRKRIVIKRVAKIEDGFMYCLGDNPSQSYDSRNYGWVSLNDIVCKPIKSRKRGSSNEQ